jgi:hypothetical protein
MGASDRCPGVGVAPRDPLGGNQTTTVAGTAGLVDWVEAGRFQAQPDTAITTPS